MLLWPTYIISEIENDMKLFFMILWRISSGHFLFCFQINFGGICCFIVYMDGLVGIHINFVLDLLCPWHSPHWKNYLHMAYKFWILNRWYFWEQLIFDPRLMCMCYHVALHLSTPSFPFKFPDQMFYITECITLLLFFFLGIFMIHFVVVTGTLKEYVCLACFNKLWFSLPTWSCAVLAIVLVGLLYGFFIAIICGQRINERHYHVLAKQELTKVWYLILREYYSLSNHSFWSFLVE